MNGLQRTGAFVVQFKVGSDFDTGNVAGRVEHIASGATEYFSSVDQLLSTLARVLKENGPERHDGE